MRLCVKCCVYLVLGCVVIMGSYVLYRSFVAEDEAQVLSDRPPIVLVHGYNQDDAFWSEVDLIDSLESRGHQHVGNFVLQGEEFVIQGLGEIAEGESAVYTLALPELGTVDIKRSAQLLAQGVEHVAQRHNSESVRLVGFSMGGVVIREYITAVPDAPVGQVTSVSTPHLGSEHAFVAQIYQTVQQQLAELDEVEKQGWRKRAARVPERLALRLALKSLDEVAESIKIPVDSAAARMLVPPDGENYLAVLNRKVHPEDVEYHCVVTEENILTMHWRELRRDWQKVQQRDLQSTHLTAATIDLGRHFTARLSDKPELASKQHFRGDGVVSCVSQDMNQIDFFAQRPELTAKVHRVASSHIEAEIQAALLAILLPDGE